MQRNLQKTGIMLTPFKIEDYCKQYQPEWTCTMPEGCPPEDVLVPLEHPEVDNALYLGEAKNESLTAATLLQPSDITEEKLPEAGYYFDATDLTDETEPTIDTYQ